MSVDVLVCGDEETFRRVRRTAHGKGYSVSGMIEPRGHSHDELRARVEDRKNKQRGWSPCRFDSADAVLLQGPVWSTWAEPVRRLMGARVVIADTCREPEFDLGMRCVEDEPADLRLSFDLIDNPGLWFGPPWTGFRPWSWSTVREMVEAQRRREKAFAEYGREGMLGHMGFEDGDRLTMSDSAVGFLDPRAEGMDELPGITFDEFRNRECQRGGGDSWAAARLGKWLNGMMVPMEKPLADLPHLIGRRMAWLGLRFVEKGLEELPGPWLSGSFAVEEPRDERVGDPELWNRMLTDPDKVEAASPEMGRCRARRAGDLAGRRLYWSDRLWNLPETRAVWSGPNWPDYPDLVWLEDQSRFSPFGESRSFRSDLRNGSNPWMYAGVSPEVSYRPMIAFCERVPEGTPDHM